MIIQWANNCVLKVYSSLKTIDLVTVKAINDLKISDFLKNHHNCDGLQSPALYTEESLACHIYCDTGHPLLR